MIIEFRNDYLQKLFEGKDVPGKPKYSKDIITKFKKTILKMQFADNIRQLSASKALNFELLKGELKGKYSVRVDYHYRLILSLQKGNSVALRDILIVEDLTNHYQ